MLINLSHLGLLQVAGKDAKKLLQGQLTCDMNDITPTQSRMAAHCNPQGRILSLSRVFWFNDSYYLQMPRDALAEALNALKKYAVFYAVELKEASDSLARISYSGRGIAKLLYTLPEDIDAVASTDSLVIMMLPGIPTHYEIIGLPNAVTPIVKQLMTIDTQPQAENLWRLKNISAGIPTIYSATIAKLLPHEINLPQINAVSFSKGCYTGQEIIARMHYRGQTKKQMYRARVKTATPPLPGEDIHTDAPCGTIVDSCLEQDNSYQILVVANSADKDRKQLFLDPGQTQPLEFDTLPY